jgi:4-amino-4-deoxy-L-arabinose transferase-like glycosyltransferase
VSRDTSAVDGNVTGASNAGVHTTTTTALPRSGAGALSGSASTREAPAAYTDRPGAGLTGIVALLVAVGTLGALFGGPALGDHETIVALCARNMLLTGDWVVPDFLETPFFRKPPLPYWLVAAVSSVLPVDPATSLPVTTMSARLPTAFAALGTVLLLWRLASSMFGWRTGMATAVLAGSSIFLLLYAANATAEMLLTFCCTWAFLHFWYAVTAGTPGTRFVHIMLFYVAMGFGMLAKGPAPVAMVGFPLAFWWYTQRPLRMLARVGPRRVRLPAVAFVRGLWLRTVEVFTRLWILPGLLLFGLIFVPWMLQVAARHEHAWNMWNWQYWQRAQGNYEDTRVRSVFYYLPYVIGMTIPWLFLLPEAVAGPWMRRYAVYRRALLYAGLWALIGVLVMSLMEFKKPYYIAPAIPGLLLLMGVVASRFYQWSPPRGPIPLELRWGFGSRRIVIRSGRRAAWAVWWLLGAGAILLVVVGRAWLRGNVPEVAAQLAVVSIGVVMLLLLAGAVYIRGRGWAAMGLTAATSILAFHAVWYMSGPDLDNVGKVAALDAALDEAGVPDDARILWTDGRPDSRLSFYFNRRPGYIIPPEEVVTRMVDRTSTASKRELREMAIERAALLLRQPEPVYLVMDQRNYELHERYMPGAGRILATVDTDPHSTAKDWVVVTNLPLPAGS